MLRVAVSTGAVTEARITRNYGRGDEALQKWQALIDDQLIEWGRDPSQLEDEDIQPPSKDTIRLAISLARLLSRADCPAPTRVVADAHGGIVFERHERNVFESIRLSDDGSAEYCLFENARLVGCERGVLSPLAANDQF
jgi:hypothetical protein